MPSRGGGGAQPERDWGSLRGREWQPTGESPTAPDGKSQSQQEIPPSATTDAAPSAAPAGRAAAPAARPAPAAEGSVGGMASNGSAKAHGTGSSRGFATDAEITGVKAEAEGSSGGRALQRFDFAAFSGGATADELALGTSTSLKGWDQFKVNEQKFGVVSTFKADLSQYTTVLDKRKITKEMRLKADRIAREMEDGGVHVRDEEYNDDNAADEEDLFSGVSRQVAPWAPGTKSGKQSAEAWHEGDCGEGDASGWEVGDGAWEGDADAGKALLASLKGTSGTARSADGDHRALVASTVQDWWRSQSMAGMVVPNGADTVLVCPFSHRAVGDVSQLVTHWAAALPRAADLPGAVETPSMEVSEHFGRAAQDLPWADMAAVSGLDLLLPTSAPRAGSVWEMILARLGHTGTRPSAGDAGNPSERPVIDFLSEAVKLKCWRRDQKIEHREIMEGIAAGLAIATLSKESTGSVALWVSPAAGPSHLGAALAAGCDDGLRVCH